MPSSSKNSLESVRFVTSSPKRPLVNDSRNNSHHHQHQVNGSNIKSPALSSSSGKRKRMRESLIVTAAPMSPRIPSQQSGGSSPNSSGRRSPTGDHQNTAPNSPRQSQHNIPSPSKRKTSLSFQQRKENLARIKEELKHHKENLKNFQPQKHDISLDSPPTFQSGDVPASVNSASPPTKSSSPFTNISILADPEDLSADLDLKPFVHHTDNLQQFLDSSLDMDSSMDEHASQLELVVRKMKRSLNKMAQVRDSFNGVTDMNKEIQSLKERIQLLEKTLSESEDEKERIISSYTLLRSSVKEKEQEIVDAMKREELAVLKLKTQTHENQLISQKLQDTMNLVLRIAEYKRISFRQTARLYERICNSFDMFRRSMKMGDAQIMEKLNKMHQQFLLDTLRYDGKEHEEDLELVELILSNTTNSAEAKAWLEDRIKQNQLENEVRATLDQVKQNHKKLEKLQQLQKQPSFTKGVENIKTSRSSRTARTEKPEKKVSKLNHRHRRPVLERRASLPATTLQRLIRKRSESTRAEPTLKRSKSVTNFQMLALEAQEKISDKKIALSTLLENPKKYENKISVRDLVDWQAEMLLHLGKEARHLWSENELHTDLEHERSIMERARTLSMYYREKERAARNEKELEAEQIAVIRDLELLEKKRLQHAMRVRARRSNSIHSEERCILYMCIDQYNNLFKADTLSMESSMKIFRRQVRTLSNVHAGDIFQDEKSRVCIIFKDLHMCLNFAFDLQLRLHDAHWPKQLLKLPGAKVIKDAEGEVIFRGLRVKIGVNVGSPLISSDEFGKLQYLGSSLDRTRHIAEKAAGGEIVIGSTAFQYLRKWNLKEDFSCKVEVRLKSIEMIGTRVLLIPETLRTLMPEPLRNRPLYHEASSVRIHPGRCADLYPMMQAIILAAANADPHTLEREEALDVIRHTYMDCAKVLKRFASENNEYIDLLRRTYQFRQLKHQSHEHKRNIATLRERVRGMAGEVNENCSRIMSMLNEFTSSLSQPERRKYDWTVLQRNMNEREKLLAKLEKKLLERDSEPPTPVVQDSTIQSQLSSSSLMSGKEEIAYLKQLLKQKQEELSEELKLPVDEDDSLVKTLETTSVQTTMSFDDFTKEEEAKENPNKEQDENSKSVKEKIVKKIAEPAKTQPKKNVQKKSSGKSVTGGSSPGKLKKKKSAARGDNPESLLQIKKSPLLSAKEKMNPPVIRTSSGLIIAEADDEDESNSVEQTATLRRHSSKKKDIEPSSRRTHDTKTNSTEKNEKKKTLSKLSSDSSSKQSASSGTIEEKPASVSQAQASESQSSETVITSVESNSSTELSTTIPASEANGPDDDEAVNDDDNAQVESTPKKQKPEKTNHRDHEPDSDQFQDDTSPRQQHAKGNSSIHASEKQNSSPKDPQIVVDSGNSPQHGNASSTHNSPPKINTSDEQATNPEGELASVKKSLGVVMKHAEIQTAHPYMDDQSSLSIQPNYASHGNPDRHQSLHSPQEYPREQNSTTNIGSTSTFTESQKRNIPAHLVVLSEDFPGESLSQLKNRWRKLKNSTAQDDMMEVQVINIRARNIEEKRQRQDDEESPYADDSPMTVKTVSPLFSNSLNHSPFYQNSQRAQIQQAAERHPQHRVAPPQHNYNQAPVQPFQQAQEELPSNREEKPGMDAYFAQLRSEYLQKFKKNSEELKKKYKALISRENMVRNHEKQLKKLLRQLARVAKDHDNGPKHVSSIEEQHHGDEGSALLPKLNYYRSSQDNRRRHSMSPRSLAQFSSQKDKKQPTPAVIAPPKRGKVLQGHKTSGKPSLYDIQKTLEELSRELNAQQNPHLQFYVNGNSWFDSFSLLNPKHVFDLVAPFRLKSHQLWGPSSLNSDSKWQFATLNEF